MRKIAFLLVTILGCCLQVIAQTYETGAITVLQPDGNTWYKVLFENTYVQPVVITGPITDFGNQPAGIRVRNVTSTSFEYQVEEFEYYDGTHDEETFSYIVVDRGVYTINGATYEAGIAVGRTDNTSQIVSLDGTFDGSPVVFTQLASEEDPTAAVVRIDNVTANNFELWLYEEEALDQQRSAADTVHFLAIQQGDVSLPNGQAYTAGVTPAEVDHIPYALSFSSFQNPILFAAAQTRNGSDPFYMRYSELHSEGVNIRMHEEESDDNETSHVSPESAGYLIVGNVDSNKRLLWVEDFDLTDGTTSDAGNTAWATDVTNLNTAGSFEVESEAMVATATVGEVIWTSEEIPISGYDNVKVAVDIQGGWAMDNADYINVYYRLDGGPETPLINGLQRNDLTITTTMIGGLVGNSVQIIVKAKGDDNNEIHRFDNVRVFVESDDRYAIQNGNWDDPNTWSYTPGGASCQCIPDLLSNTHIDGYTVDLREEGYTKNLTVYNASTLRWGAHDKDLILYGDATLDVQSGGKIDQGSYNDANLFFKQWEYLNPDNISSRVGTIYPGVSVVINVDNPAGLRVRELALDAQGTYTIQGSGNITLTEDFDINHTATVTNNLQGEITIAQHLEFGYPDITFTNNGTITINEDIQYQRERAHLINQGTMTLTQLVVSTSQGSELTNGSGSTFRVQGLFDMGNNNFIAHNYGTLEIAGDIRNLEVDEVFFHNHEDAEWIFGGAYISDDFYMFAHYENNTVHYNGGEDQKVIIPRSLEDPAQVGPFWHLTLSNKNTTGTTISNKHPTAANIDINGNLTMIGTAEGMTRFDIKDVESRLGTKADITIAGNWWQDERSGSDPVQYHEGTLATDETVTFDGTEDQHIRIDEEYISININKLSGQLLLDNGSRIRGNMIFTEGIVVAQNDIPIVMRNEAQALQASDASHVQGKVTKQGVADFTFPIGDGTHYQPLEVNGLSESADFTAEYINTPIPNPTAKPDSMINLGTCGYWTLSRTNGNAEAYVTLFWNESTCPVDIDELIIARWDGTQWVSEGKGTLSGDATAGSITSASRITDFGTPANPGLFTLAELSGFPVAVADTLRTSEDAAREVNLLVNDSDDSGLDYATIDIMRQAQHGSVTINYTTGEITYSPVEDYFGLDSLIYTVQDYNELSSNQATLIIIIEPVNDPPVALNDNAGTSFAIILEGPSVLDNDSDPVEGDALSASLIDAPSNGTIDFRTDGTYTYTPSATFSGTDRFTYQACDEGTPSACDTTIVTIIIHPLNYAPQAQRDVFTVSEDESLAGNILSNDTDINPEDILTVGTEPVHLLRHGAVTLELDGSFTYIPEPNFFGTDSLAYQVCDNGSPSLCDTAWLIIYISPVNDTPVAVADTFDIAENENINSQVLANDYDAEGNTFENVTLVSGPAYGELALQTDGNFSYAPQEAFVGEDQFTYQLCDQQNSTLCSQATVTIRGQPGLLAIPKGFSPNNDRTNDQWIIEGIRAFPTNQVKIFNRWGNVVYQASGYDNVTTVWGGETTQGITVGKGQLPDGTYFYVIDLGNQQKPLSGYLLLKR